MTRPRIAVDGMGGDHGPDVAVPAAETLAADADIVLVGDEATLRSRACGKAALQFLHASEVLRADDSLSTALRRKPDSSLRKALSLLADGSVDAVVSGGDTAQLMVLSRQILGMVPGVQRPAIAKVMRGVKRDFWMLDLGANLDCEPRVLLQFARMGSVMAETLGAVQKPRVALLNIGTEAAKGPEVLGRAAELLAAAPGINYTGFIEGNRLFDNAADVIVCDGFAGNIALKSVEGAAAMAGHLLRSAVNRLSPLQKAGLWLLRGALSDLRDEFNPQQYNGASLVGLNGVVVKSHGSADRVGFEAALREALNQARFDIPGLLRRAFEQELNN